MTSSTILTISIMCHFCPKTIDFTASAKYTNRFESARHAL